MTTQQPVQLTSAQQTDLAQAQSRELAPLLNAIAHHRGQGRGIPAERLAEVLHKSPRQMRKLISQARDEGYAICGHPLHGYYLAMSADELQQSCRFLEHRALHSLRLLARMRGVAMPELLGQLKLNQA